MTELVVLIGLPGAGKSTLGKQYIERRVCAGELFWTCCSSDKTRRMLYGDERIQGKPDTVFRNLHEDVERHLKEGTNVVYDATNVTRKNRKQIILLGKKYNCKIRAVVAWAPVDVCIERDAARDRTVGPAVIMKMLKRFEVPYFDEGFDTIDVYNTVDHFDEAAYDDKLLEDMKIPHDNPHHIYDVYDHCIAAQDCAKEHYSPIIAQAARYHDCGKPLAKFFKDGEITAHYYNHDNISGYLSLGLSKITTALITGWLISNHMQPFFKSHYYMSLSPELKKQLDELHECDLKAH